MEELGEMLLLMDNIGIIYNKFSMKIMSIMDKVVDKVADKVVDKKVVDKVADKVV